MQELRITTPDPQGHYHIVYINSETGMGAMSADPENGHQHQLIYDPPREPIEPTPAMLVNPQTGQQIPAPEDPAMVEQAIAAGAQLIPAEPGDPGKEVGSWIIGPGGAEAGGEIHEHELLEYPAAPPKKKQDDKVVLTECMALWREALSLTEDCRKKGRESEDFYKGKQWDDGVKREMDRLDRAALTLNEVAANIDTLIGYQMEQRTDIRYLPQEGGDQRVADMLNVVSKRILDGCYYQREKTKVFKDICVPGFGAFNLYMDFNESIQGVPKVERFPWDSINYGPHEKEDLSDCEYEERDRMMSIAKLKQMFAKKADEIEASYKHYCGQYPDIEKNDNGISGTHTDYQSAKKLDDQPFTVDGTLPLVDVQKKQFRLVQITRKNYIEVTIIFNQEENFFFTAYDWEEKDVALAAALPGFQVVSQLKPRMRITKFCGQVILSDENPADLPVHDFFTVPVYGYRQNGEFWGKVEAAKDPQRELNKRRSQVMDIMNRLGASVYYTTPETFVDKNEKERFKKNRSKPGSIFDVQDLNNTPKLEEGSDLPVGLVQIMQMDQENLQRLMNVVVQQESANESGALFLEKKKGRLTGNQFLFDNMSFAEQKLGKLLLAIIQRYYPAERMLRLLNSQYSKQKFEVGGQDFSQFSKEEVIEMLESSDLLEYDVIVSESSFAASTRLGIAKVLFELISQGAVIPPELPLEFIDMPSDTRTKITESLQQQSEATSQQAADTSNTEITKTLLAKGQYTVTPERAQELGLIPAGPESQLQNGAGSPNNQADTTQDTQYADNLAGALAG